MPGRNTLKVFVEDHCYHIYNRGWNRSNIFLEDSDYRYFESLLQRHISITPCADEKGRLYAHLRPEVDLVSYCLMPNHFHMLVYIREQTAATRLMRSVLTAYTMYFNRKYKRRGPLYENRFKAVPILDDSQLMHITRYIHLNKANYASWQWSSYRDFLADNPRNWIAPESILELFESKQAYREFVDDYAELQRERDNIKRELANG